MKCRRILALRRKPFVLTLALLFGAMGAGGCGKDNLAAPRPGPVARPTPGSVIDSLQSAYRTRDIRSYAEILAADFAFRFDPETRPEGIPENWTRFPDSTATSHLFSAIDVANIEISLTYGDAVEDDAPGHERWRRIRVTYTDLKIGLPIVVGRTISVSGDAQDFYMRRGYTPGDTLDDSPTAKQWFLVEWHDLGRLSGQLGVRTPVAASAPATFAYSWSQVKALWR